MTSKNFRAESNRKHVVIVGGGFAGVYAAKRLADTDVNITLIDRNNYFLFQPLLYQVATGLLEPSEVATTLRQLFRDQDNVRVIKGEVTDIDTTAKTVIATIDDAPYWLGTRNDKNYTTVGPCKTEYEGFYCQFYA